MGQSISFLLATSSPESVTRKFVLERFPVKGCDLTPPHPPPPPDMNNTVTFLMALLVARTPWHYSTSVFSPPLPPLFLPPFTQGMLHIYS